MLFLVSEGREGCRLERGDDRPEAEGRLRGGRWSVSRSYSDMQATLVSIALPSLLWWQESVLPTGAEGRPLPPSPNSNTRGPPADKAKAELGARAARCCARRLSHGIRYPGRSTVSRQACPRTSVELSCQVPAPTSVPYGFPTWAETETSSRVFSNRVQTQVNSP